MNKKEFLKVIKAELYHHPYRDRFLEEIEDHLEDIECEMNKGAPSKKLEVSELIQKYLGEPDSIGQNFLSIMHPFRKLLYFLEAIFFAILLIPLTIFFGTPSNVIILSDQQYTVTHLITYGLLLSVVLFLFYRTCFKRFLEVEFKAEKQPSLWFLIIFLCNLISYILLIINKGPASSPEENGSIVVVASYSTLHFTLAYLAWKSLKQKGSKKTKKQYKFNIHYLKIALLSYLFLSIITKIILVNSIAINSNVLENISIATALLSPLIPIELNIYRWWQEIISLNLNAPSLWIVFYIPMGMIFFIGILSLWVTARQKKWFPLRSLVIFYVISLFLIRPEAFTKAEDFMVPALNISKPIEKNQMGIMYPIFKYFNYKQGLFFQYEIGFEKGEGNKSPGFLIKNNAEKYTFIPYPPLNNGETEFIFNYPKTDIPSSINLPRNFLFDRKKRTDKNFNAFVEKYILEKTTTIVSDAVFSTDGKWGLIAVKRELSDPEEVYLVDLRNIKTASP